MVVLKNKYVIIFITCLAVFFFFGAFKVNAQEVIIVEKPTASDIIYGEPLFESVLRGGSGNVPGTFSWKNQRNTFTVGKHTEVVVFTPNDSNYAPVETSVVFNVNKRRVYIKFEEEIRKLYDGTNKIELPNYIVGGIGVYSGDSTLQDYAQRQVEKFTDTTGVLSSISMGAVSGFMVSSGNLGVAAISAGISAVSTITSKYYKSYI